MATKDSSKPVAPSETEQKPSEVICGPWLARVTFHDDEALSGIDMANRIEVCLLDVFDVARSALFDEAACMEHNASAFVGVIELSRMCLGMAMAMRAEAERAKAHGFTP